MITVFGSINMDLIASVDRLPKPGETVAGTAFSTAAGGKGANQALAAQRAGSQVNMVGAVGNDTFAEPSVQLLREAGADLSHVSTAQGATGTALILVGGDGENVIAVVPAANATVSSDDARRTVAAMSPGDILMLQLELPAASVESALSAARQKGITSVINIAPLIPEASHLGRLADIVIANETEFERLAGETEMTDAAREAAMQRLYAESRQTLIVTLGANGVIAIKDGALHQVAGLRIEPVDTVGAGDTFCGYFAASLDQGLDFPQALRRAAVAGSLACLRHGAQPSIPLAAEVSQRL